MKTRYNLSPQTEKGWVLLIPASHRKVAWREGEALGPMFIKLFGAFTELVRYFCEGARKSEYRAEYLGILRCQNLGSFCNPDALCMQSQAQYARLAAQHSPQPAQPSFFHEMCLVSATCMRCALLRKCRSLLHHRGSSKRPCRRLRSDLSRPENEKSARCCKLRRPWNVNVVTTCAGYVSSQVKKGGVGGWISELGHAVYSSSNA